MFEAGEIDPHSENIRRAAASFLDDPPASDRLSHSFSAATSFEWSRGAAPDLDPPRWEKIETLHLHPDRSHLALFSYHQAG